MAVKINEGGLKKYNSRDYFSFLFRNVFKMLLKDFIDSIISEYCGAIFFFLSFRMLLIQG